MAAPLQRAEQRRLENNGPAWRQWGPYVSERAWGTVREDYSTDGDAWTFFPFDHARSRAYRWSEDGLAGICDERQLVCLAFSFWNGVDPFLKERIFGLTGPQGNHGEDAKEYWWYEDCTPTHSWMRWRYAYSQRRFPYEELVEQNRIRGRDIGEYELVDTGVFDDNAYWDISVDYAKADVDDICVRLTARNAGTQQATLHILPTVWARNTWAWERGATRPVLSSDERATIAVRHPDLGDWTFSSDGVCDALFCDNDTNTERLWNQQTLAAFPKDGINDYVVEGHASVNPARTGTKAALHHRCLVEGGESVEVRLRLRAAGARSHNDFEATMRSRELEADEFYADLAPSASDEEQLIMRRALSGMLWSKQLYHYNVEQWLEGDSNFAPPPPERRSGRNAGWLHLDNFDVISMPDKWEYPWYAAWDLAFHCVSLAHVDASFAKQQLLLMLREWYMNPNGQLPAYEWNFGDVNPPVHGWAALRVFRIDGGNDYDFLERVFNKLLLNFTWWVNRKDPDGNNLFEGGFLGLDNIGPIDRSKPLPVAGHLEQADGTAWMASYCLSLLEIAVTLAQHNRTYEDLATKFFEHFASIARAMDAQGIWDEDDGFYYDVIAYESGEREPMRVRSVVGLIPLLAVTTLDADIAHTLPEFSGRLQWFLEHKPQYVDVIGHVHETGVDDRRLLSVVGPDALTRILEVVLDEAEFLSPHGLRSVSKAHATDPFIFEIGEHVATVAYEPAESRSGLFGGNSNWRGPIWMPTNYLLIEALRRFGRFFGDDYTVRDPTGSVADRSLSDVADDLVDRLLDIFRDRDGQRPVFADRPMFGPGTAWHDRLMFHEYFHGDTGAGLGASHQTGWTGLIADLIIERASRRA